VSHPTTDTLAAKDLGPALRRLGERGVLVTGATGFIGGRLVGRLLAEGVEPRALVLPGEEVPVTWAGAVEVVRGDVADPEAAEAVVGMGTVFHLAAVVGDWGPQEHFQRVTVDGTRHLLTAAARAGARVVLVSSITVYGDQLGRQVCGEDRPLGHPLGPYSGSKQAQERLALKLEAEAGLEVVRVRPANVYGPGSRPWVNQVVEHLAAGLPALVGRQPKVAGLVHVDNVVEVLVRSVVVPGARGRAYNAAEDSQVTWRQYFEDLSRLAGTSPPKTVPALVARLGAVLGESLYRLVGARRRPPLTREALNLVGSHHRLPIDRAREELGYRPRISYAEGLATVAAYLESAGPLPVTGRSAGSSPGRR
jgi:nucleoside-diphosphate-sugar epimerase